MRKKVWIPIVIMACLVAVWIGIRTTSRNAINGEWSVTTVQDDNGTVIMCSHDEMSNWPDAEESSISLQADNGQFTITDADHSWSGVYEYNKSNLAGTIYTIELTEDGTDYQGLAVASNRLLFGGGSNRVLTLTVLYGDKNYTLYFGKTE